MLYAYLDESGQEQTGDWMSVGGFLGNQDQWLAATALWREAIAPRKWLHLADLRFKKEREQRLLVRAGSVPDRAGLTPLMAVAKVEDYLDMIAGTERARAWNGYTVCTFALVIATLRAIPPNERLEIIFEEQQRYGWYASIALGALCDISERFPELRCADGNSKLAKWSFIPKHSSILLNMADYYAYALVQGSRDKRSKRAQWCKPILESNRREAYGARIDRQYAREIFSAIIDHRSATTES